MRQADELQGGEPVRPRPALLHRGERRQVDRLAGDLKRHRTCDADHERHGLRQGNAFGTVMARCATVPLCADLRADDLELHRHAESRTATVVLIGEVMVNLSSFIRYHASRTPDRLRHGVKDQRGTYAEVLRGIEATSGFLAARDLRPDDVVAVFMKNSAAFLELAFAVSHIGAVFLPINFRLATEEVRYITESAGAKLLFAAAEVAEIVKPVQPLFLVVG